MDIIIERIDPFTESECVDQIAQVYQAAFAGPPWFESWEMETIISDFKSEMRRPGALCVVARVVEDRIIGFAWGYEVSPSSELDQHLDAPGVHCQLQGPYFYLDECAVTPALHGQGIGKQLVSAIFAEQQHKEVLLRTKDGSPMFHLITKIGGQVIQDISHARVIMKVARA